MGKAIQKHNLQVQADTAARNAGTSAAHRLGKAIYPPGKSPPDRIKPVVDVKGIQAPQLPMQSIQVFPFQSKGLCLPLLGKRLEEKFQTWQALGTGKNSE